MDFTERNFYTYNNEEVEYHYSPTMTYSEQVSFVKSVSNMVLFNDGTYIPLLKDIMFNFFLINDFTDIDISMFNNEFGDFDIDKFADFDNNTGLSNSIKTNIDTTLLYNLIDSVDSCIAYKTGISKDNIGMAVVELINTLKKKIDTFGNNIDSDTVLKFMQNFNESGLNANEIAKVYFNSNEFKHGIAEVVDEKNATIKKLRNKIVENEVQNRARNVLADKKE